MPSPGIILAGRRCGEPVFTLFIYSLTVAFGNVGEALAIVVMVIQVAGAGGTFPIETLPKVYQMLYKYLPFPYGHECHEGDDRRTL